MRRMLDKLHARLGDLWWYTILMFIAQRIGDVINMFLGLFLIPRYVPMDELGAVLPITQFIGFIGLPLSIAAIPFLKFVTLFHDKGETGKVKALVRDAFIATFSLGILAFIISYFVCPFFFERMRVAQGSLAILMLSVAILSAIGSIFGMTSAGIKCHRLTVILFALGAPLRLAIFILLAPFRVLSGYVASQASTALVAIGGTFWILRTRLGIGIRCEPYWREYGSAIIRYTIPFALWTIATTVSGNVDTLVIRQRLSDFESAGYYLLTRFSDIAAYITTAITIFLFPMTASMKAKSAESLKMLRHSILASLSSGFIFAIILYLMGEQLLDLTKTWSEYISLANLFPLLALNTGLGMTIYCFITYETAQGRFRFLWYSIPLLAIKAIFIYSITGYTFFQDIMSQDMMKALEAFNPCRLSFLITLFLIANLAHIVMLTIDVFFNKPRERSNPHNDAVL